MATSDCYDYVAHVLWHAHAGQLWDRFTRVVRRRLAVTVGLPQSRFPEYARLSFAKVAEYQKRAAVHVHAVVRLDGPAGPADPPPDWGRSARLSIAVQAAARSAVVRTSYSPAVGEHGLRWGREIDVRPLRARTENDGLTDDAVAAYVAKYVTKGASETAAGADRRLSSWDDIDAVSAPLNVRTLMRTCWSLGGLAEFESLRLRSWAHTLGFRGHILTKSRAYSATYAALREERVAHEGYDDLPAAVTDVFWRYVGSGHTPGAALIAAGVAKDLARNREIAWELRKLGERL
ncbi:replication initiator [Streptomyces sioyaensis]|uniref:replication initiator n=1 Tax=Streptomyces sioyaensis TaxID=67364 RepID=UPI0036585234